ncbi:MAG: FAD-dependent oxidoreductase, partial [Gemmatimonadaceae bacterium]
MSARRFIVVGGGFAGAAAAAHLHSQGATVVLLDERPMLGGRARSDAMDGLTIDVGAQLVTTSFARTLRLLNGGGAAQRAATLRKTGGRDALVMDGRRYPIQFGSIRSLLSFSRLSAMEKLKLGRHLLPLLARHRHHLDASAEQLPPALDRESARQFVEANVGAHAADLLVEPSLNPFYGAAGSETSLAFFLTLGRYGAESDLLAPADGWSAALAVRLRDVTTELGARAVAIDVENGGVRVRTADGRSHVADGVVLATGARTAQALLAPLLSAEHPLLRWLSAVEVRRTWTLALSLDAVPRRDAFGLFAPPGSAGKVSACAVHGAKLGGAAPPGRDVVLAWPTPPLALELGDAEAERIVDAMMPDVERMVPECRGRVTRARVYRFDEGT